MCLYWINRKNSSTENQIAWQIHLCGFLMLLFYFLYPIYVFFFPVKDRSDIWLVDFAWCHCIYLSWFKLTIIYSLSMKMYLSWLHFYVWPPSVKTVIQQLKTVGGLVYTLCRELAYYDQQATSCLSFLLYMQELRMVFKFFEWFGKIRRRWFLTHKIYVTFKY